MKLAMVDKETTSSASVVLDPKERVKRIMEQVERMSDEQWNLFTLACEAIYDDARLTGRNEE